MNITWIRHGEKTYKNGNAPPGSHDHDPPLKRNVIYKVTELCNYLDFTTGTPTKIITSPYTRTRETSKMIRDYYYRKYNIFIPIYVDNNISEFLGWKKPIGGKADVSEETSSFISPILGTEKLKDVEERTKKHIENLTPDNFTLVITHGIVINYVNKYLTGFKFNNIKELKGITLKNNIVEKIDY